MNDEIAIKAEHISKKYCKSQRMSMLYGMRDVARNMLRLSSHSEKLRKNEFWAVDDVSFEVRKGETLGILGLNGAGKSTILKMLNGIFWPDKGKITIKGRVGTLIEAGAGFHPLLTGRENIYLNAAMMGMTRQEVDEKMEDIIEFADIGDFLDTPVKFYSNGMPIRLRFAIAAYCELDILLIDEIFAVGDMPFRIKCYNKIAEISKKCAVVIVSHNMSAISRMVSKCMVLNNSHSCFQGNTQKAIQHYCSIFDERKINAQHIAGSGEARIEGVKLYNRNNKETETFRYGDPMKIAFGIHVLPEYKTFVVLVTFMNQEMQLIAQCHSSFNNVIPENDGYLKNIQLTIPTLMLNTGKYTINFTIFDKTNQKWLCWNYMTKVFSVIGEFEFVGCSSIQLMCSWEDC